MAKDFLLLLILNLLLISNVTPYTHEVFDKYSSKKTKNKYIVLDSSGFDVDETIYISLTTRISCKSPDLYYQFYKTIEDKQFLSYKNSVSYSSKSESSVDYTYNYKITKQNSDNNYLYLESKCIAPLVFENTKHDTSKVNLIVSIVCSIIVVAIIIITIVCICKRRKAALAATVTPVPVTPTYGVSPYPAQPVISVSPQPVVTVQPYGNNYIQGQNYNNPTYNQNYNNQNNYNPDVQYNSAAGAQSASDYRENQGYTSSKPQY